MRARTAVLLLVALVGLAFPGNLARAQGRLPLDSNFADGGLLIAVVWPQDGAGNGVPLDQSRAVNLSVWPRAQVGCRPRRGEREIVDRLRVQIARNDEPPHPIDDRPGKLQLVTVDGVTFPSLEFDDIPADLVSSPSAVFRIYIGLPGGVSNVWVHGLDGAVRQPVPVAPTGVGYFPSDPSYRYAPRIQAVSVHGDTDRPLADFAVDIFWGPRSVDQTFDPDYFVLDTWRGDDTGRGVAGRPSLEKTPVTTAGVTHPRWVFRDVPLDPTQSATFGAFLHTEKLDYLPANLWTWAPEGMDILTHLPDPPVPPPCVPN